MTPNGASVRVMEKCGMKLEATRVARFEKFAEPVELVRYSITREEWKAFQ